MARIIERLIYLEKATKKKDNFHQYLDDFLFRVHKCYGEGPFVSSSVAFKTRTEWNRYFEDILLQVYGKKDNAT